MKGANRPITSREYKLMLNVDRFGDRKAGIQAFARLFEFLVDSQGGEIVERHLVGGEEVDRLKI